MKWDAEEQQVPTSSPKPDATTESDVGGVDTTKTGAWTVWRQY